LGKENAQPTYKGGIGFCPNLATCDNTDDVRTAPRTTSPCWSGRCPGCGAATGVGCWCAPAAGFSHELLEHIAAGGGTRGQSWEFSVGWSCTDKEIDAIEHLPIGAWTAGIDQNGDLTDDTFVADLTGLLNLGRWHNKIPGLRVIVRDEPLHPRYRKRATEREKQLGRRYQLIAINAKVWQVAWLDARHRSMCTSRTTSSRPRTWPEPVALAALVDLRGVDPGRRPGREPAGLFPPPGLPRG